MQAGDGPSVRASVITQTRKKYVRRRLSASGEWYVCYVTILNTPTSPWKMRSLPAQDRAGDRLDLVLRFSNAVGCCRDLDEFVLRVGQETAAAFEADRACLYLFDAARFELWTRTFDAQGELHHENRIPADHGLCGRVFATHRPLCIRELRDDARLLRDAVSYDGCAPHSLLIAPLASGPNHGPAVLQVMDHRVGHFSEEDLVLLEALCDIAAVAMENLCRHLANRRQFQDFVSAIASAIDARDLLTATHSLNVANYALGIGTILGLPVEELHRVHVAGLLHDVGKIGVPEAVLTRAGRFSQAELEEMRQHPRHTQQILSKVRFTGELEGADFIAGAHHERLDGSGYPDGYRAENLPLQARILAVADAYDALTQTRHHRRAMSMHEALKELDGMTPDQLDRRCVAALKAFLNSGPWPMLDEEDASDCG